MTPFQASQQEEHTSLSSASVPEGSVASETLLPSPKANTHPRPRFSKSMNHGWHTFVQHTLQWVESSTPSVLEKLSPRALVRLLQHPFSDTPPVTETPDCTKKPSSHLRRVLKGRMTSWLRYSRQRSRQYPWLRLKPIPFTLSSLSWHRPLPDKSRLLYEADEHKRLRTHQLMLGLYLGCILASMALVRYLGLPQGTSSLFLLLTVGFYGSTLSVLLTLQQRREAVERFIQKQLSTLRDMVQQASFVPANLVKWPETHPPVEAVEESLAPSLPKVAVFIPAHNEASVIVGTVRQLLKQTYPHWECWVLNDRSQDDTQACLDALEAELPHYYRQILHCHHRPQDAEPGKSAVLNEALTLTDAPLVAVFDADAWVPEDWLMTMVPQLIVSPWVAGLQSRKVILNQGDNWLTRCQAMEYYLDSYIQMCRDAVRSAVELRGNGMILKREALLSVNGWTHHTVTDDLDLSSKLHLVGWDIRFMPHTPVYEEGIQQLKPLLKQRRRWAEGSLRRYLDYGWAILARPVSARAKLDVMVYFMNFTAPVWMVCDYVWWLFTLKRSIHEVMSQGHIGVHHVLTLGLIGVLTVVLIPVVWHASRQFEQPSHGMVAGLKRWWESTMTAFYMGMTWTMSVFGILIDLLCRKEPTLKWDKTSHGLPPQPATPS
ncbi:MAG: glycosyltransferase [Vampirovibrionales bacterium]